MYLHLEHKIMSTERLTEAVARLHYLHSLMSGSPGFVEAQICEYLGNPGRYLVTRTWRDEAAHRGYRASDASKEFAASRPAHFIYDNLAVQEWQSVLESPGTEAGNYVVRHLQTIDAAEWPAQIAEREGYNTDALKSGGVTSLRMYRMLANDKADDSQVLVIDRWADRAAYVRLLEGHQAPETSLTECYQVVDEVLPR